MRSGSPKTVYIAGPMRQLPRCNFASFDRAKARLQKDGWTVISPADLDRASGFDPDRDEVTTSMVRDAFVRDVVALLMRCDAIAMLPESGDHPLSLCHVERTIAERFGMQVIELENYAE